MPECERCSETHATVCEATWVNKSILLCPGCWAEVEEWVGRTDT